MSLEVLESGHYALKGMVTFDNAAEVERNGKALLSRGLAEGSEGIRIDMSDLLHADSSTLSVCLSWIRFSRQHKAFLCFTSVPEKLQALAAVCGVDGLLKDSTCSL